MQRLLKQGSFAALLTTCHQTLRFCGLSLCFKMVISGSQKCKGRAQNSVYIQTQWIKHLGMVEWGAAANGYDYTTHCRPLFATYSSVNSEASHTWILREKKRSRNILSWAPLSYLPAVLQLNTVGDSLLHTDTKLCEAKTSLLCSLPCVLQLRAWEIEEWKMQTSKRFMIERVHKDAIPLPLPLRIQ